MERLIIGDGIDIISSYGSSVWTNNGPYISHGGVIQSFTPIVGPTIDDIYRRLAMLEAIINNGDIKAKSINNCLIGKETTNLFTDERFTSSTMGVLPVCTYQNVKYNDNGITKTRPEIGLEIGSYIDFHNVYHEKGICNEGDTCARLWVPSGLVSNIGGSLVIFNNTIRHAATGYVNPNNTPSDKRPDEWAQVLRNYQYT